MILPAPAEPDFVPAPSRRRIAGWTPARQAAFIVALADGHSVGVAAGSVGLSARSAYKLRRGAEAADFALAWDGALMQGADRLEQTAIGRVLDGQRRTVFYRGLPVGEQVVHNDGLLMFMLKHLNVSRRRKGVKR